MIGEEGNLVPCEGPFRWGKIVVLADEHDAEVARLHRIPSLEALKRIAAECSERDYCSCAPLEMSYCVTERFVKRLEEQAARFAQAEALLRAAVTPHAFNCGWIRHPDFIKMVPVYECTCGLDAFLAASGEQRSGKAGD
jgi:hypothetical protein